MARPQDDRLHSLTMSAMAGAFILMAHQVAAKAARDSLFLSYFPATDLPKVVGAAAAIGVLNAFLFARLLRRSSPVTTLAAALGLSMLAHAAEYFLIGAYRGPVVVLTYFHIISSSSISLSLLWSIASETFSPGEAKRYYGRITAAGTAGGIAGGLLAERAAVEMSLDSMLLLLAVLHGAGLIAITRLSTSGRAHPEVEDTGNLVATLRSAAGRAPFLRNLALLVLFITMSTAAVDFLFKSTAAAALEGGAPLARFFAFFYTGTQVASFLLQATITPLALRTLGLGRSVMAMPLTLGVGALVSFFAPVLAVFTATRAGEAVLRGSLYRAGYELFFTPIPASEKRGVKTAIDVGFDRMGEIVAAVLIQLLLLAGIEAAIRPLLLVTIAIAAVCVWIAARMDAAYLQSLEQGLLQRAIELDEGDIEDSTTLSGLMRSMPRIAKVGDAESVPAIEQRAPARALDPSLEYVRVLRSGVAADVRRALASHAFDALAVSQELRLLAWDEVTDAARARLESHGARITGQLADALLDRDLDFNVRRRIPRILARIGSQRVVEALQDVLDDTRFEIRFQASRALEYMHRTRTDLRFDRDRVMQAVDRDLSVSRTIWRGRRVLGKRDDSDGEFSYLDEVVRAQLQNGADQSMEHVFSLLAIVLPREPLKVAFRALNSEDRVLRGLGFEYLETALPDRTFHLFRTVLDGNPAP